MNRRIVLAPNSLNFAITMITQCAKEDGKYQMVVSNVRRSPEQNKKLWACLQDIADQVVWHGKKLPAESWKEIFSASMRRNEVVPGLDNNFVVLGQRTSNMTKEEMSELIELMLAFGADYGVVWTEQG